MLQQNGFFSFWVCWFGYVSFESTLTATREREKVRKPPFINDIDNLIFQVILNLLLESWVFYYNNIQDTFHLVVYSEILLIWIIKKIFYIKLNHHHWRVYSSIYIYIYISFFYGGAHGVMVIVQGNGHGDTSSIPGWDWLHFTCRGGACGVMVIIIGNGHGNTSSNPGWDWLHFT